MTHYQAFPVLTVPSIDRKSIDISPTGGVGSNCSPLLLKSDQPATINVRVSGRPRPKVTWFVGTNLIASDDRGSPISSTPGGRVESHGHFRYSLSVERVTDNWENDGLTIVASNEVGTDKVKVAVKTYKVLSGMSASERKSSRRLRRLLPSYVTTDSNSGSGCASSVTSPSTTSINQRKDFQKHSWNSEDWTNWHKEMEERSRMKSIDDIIDSDHDNDDLDLERAAIDDNLNDSPYVTATRRQTDIDSFDLRRSTAIDSSVYSVNSTAGSETTTTTTSSHHQTPERITFQSARYSQPHVHHLQHRSSTWRDDNATSKNVDEPPVDDVRPDDPLRGGVVPTRTDQVRQINDDPVWQLHGTRLSDVCHRLLNRGDGFDCGLDGGVSSVQQRVAVVNETAIDEVDDVLPSCVTSTTGSRVPTDSAPVIIYECSPLSDEQSRAVLVMSMTYKSIPFTDSSESHILVAPIQGVPPPPGAPGAANSPPATVNGMTPSGKPKPPVPPKPRSALVTSPASTVSQQQRQLVKSTPPPIPAKPAMSPKPPIAKKPPIGSRGDKSPCSGPGSATSPLLRQVSGPSSTPTGAVDVLWSSEHGEPVTKELDGSKDTAPIVIAASSEVLRNKDKNVRKDGENTSLSTTLTTKLEVIEDVPVKVDGVLIADNKETDLNDASRRIPEEVEVRAHVTMNERLQDGGESQLATTSPGTVEETDHVTNRLDLSRRATSMDIQRAVTSSTTSFIPSRKSEVCRASSIGSRRPPKSDSDASPLATRAKTTSEERLLPVRQGIVSNVQRSPLPVNDLHDRGRDVTSNVGLRRSTRGRSVDLTANGGYDGGNFPTSVRSSGGSVSSIGRKTISREVVTVTTTEEEIITVLRRPETHSPHATSGVQIKASAVDLESRSSVSVSDRDVDQPQRKLIAPKMATDNVTSDISVGRLKKTDFDRDSTVSLPARISVTFEPPYVRRQDADLLDTTMMTSSTSSDMLDKLIDTLTGIALAAAAEEEEDEQRRQQAATEDDNDETMTSSGAATGGILQLRGRCGRDSGVGTVQTATSY